MRSGPIRVVTALSGTVAGLVLLLGFKTHLPEPIVAASQPTTTTNNDDGTSETSTTTSSSSSLPTSGIIRSTTSTSIKTSSQYVGDEETTRWGPVKVQITVSGSKITAIKALEYPDSNGHDQQINSYAIPELTSQALSAQSANIDGVSGASYTTQGFISSLQSALDKAGLQS